MNPKINKPFKVAEVYVKTNAICVSSGSESESDSEQMHSPRSPSPQANLVAQENPPTHDLFDPEDFRQPFHPGPLQGSANSYEARCDSDSDDSEESVHYSSLRDSPPKMWSNTSNKGFHPTGSDKPGCNHQDPARPRHGKGNELRKMGWKKTCSVFIDDQAKEDKRWD